jgi:hypothetical protein
VVEWIPKYNGGHEQTFNIQYRIVNESRIWMTHAIPKYNKQTYILSGLKDETNLNQQIIYNCSQLSDDH